MNDSRGIPICNDVGELAERKDIDMERFHKFHMGEIPSYQRGSGKTLADAMTVVQLALLGNKFIFAKVEFMKDVEHIVPQLKKACTHFNLKIECSTRNVFRIFDDREISSGVKFINRQEELYGFAEGVVVEFSR